MSPAASLLLGALLGAANAAAAAWTVRRTGGLASDRALHLVLGGMVARMVLVLGAVALVLALFDVHRVAFIGGLGLLFAAGLVAEVALVLARPSTPADA